MVSRTSLKALRERDDVGPTSARKGVSLKALAEGGYLQLGLFELAHGD